MCKIQNLLEFAGISVALGLYKYNDSICKVILQVKFVMDSNETIILL